MFDSEEIAKRALLRASEIKSIKNQRRRFAAKMTGLCAVIAAAVFIAFPSFTPDAYVSLEDNPTPLAAFFLPADESNPNAGNYPDGRLSHFVPVYDSITIPADTLNAKMMLCNPDSNCDLTFDIILKTTGETLYTSDKIPPSMYVEDLTLSRAMEQGEYKATIIIRAYESGGHEAISETSMNLPMIVK